MKILAISGSLRQFSSNTTLLRAMSHLAPADMEVDIYRSLSDLPPFNPDLEGSESISVLDFRARLQASDGVLISTPEYAHGVPGVLKNALDWVVGSGEFSGKPVALINAAPWATHAQAQLTETIKTMDADYVPEASIAVSLLPKTLDSAGIVLHPEIAPALRSALEAFARTIASRSVLKGEGFGR